MMNSGLVALFLAAGLVLQPSVGVGASEDPVTQALHRALEDEQHAEAFYAAVIARHGEIRPFVNIIRAEQRHASMVVAALEAAGVSPLPNPYKDGTKVAPVAPASIAEACKIGVDAEIANIDLYDKELIPAAVGKPDIVALFEALRDASRNNHLPAFKRCAS